MNQFSNVPRVLVFDSGIGGLSIAAAIGGYLPDWQLVYLADNAYFPYGDQPETLVIQRCVSLIEAVLSGCPVDMIVIGCNTASTVVLPALRERFDCPVIGVVPAVKPAAVASRNRSIGLLATPATVRRPYLDGLISEFAADCRITRVGSSELVRLVEKWLESGEIPRPDCARILDPLRAAGVDTVILGCTHFPLIQSQLASLLGPEVVWLDSGAAIARRVEFIWHSGACGERRAGALSEAEGAGFLFFFTGAEPEGLRDFLARGAWPEPLVHAHFASGLALVERSAR